MKAPWFTLVLCLVLMVASTAWGEWRSVYSMDGPQDSLFVEGPVDELGNGFPPDELITSSYITDTTYRPCPEQPDDTGIPNVVVSITNMTNIGFEDLYYVADPETSLQNYDGWIDEVPVAVGVNQHEAFRIDDVGINTPLISESIAGDLIFAPGETWEFVIQDYTNGLGLMPHLFGTVGVASASTGDTFSSGSIITPEPGSLLVMLLGTLVLVRRRR